MWGQKSGAAQPESSGDRLVFQRGNSLFVSELDGSGARLLVVIGSPDAPWAISRDGRRIAWLRRGGSGPDDAGLTARPTTIHLTDSLGRRYKKLAVTSALRDRLGRVVDGFGPTTPEGAESPPSAWRPASLCFSADSHLVYLGVRRTDGEIGANTVAIDSVSGAAVVNGDIRWRSLIPAFDVDARGTLLVGAGIDDSRGALLLLSLTDGELSGLVRGDGEIPRAALSPSLSPDLKRIAFAGGSTSGLWVVNRDGSGLKRVVRGDVASPRFSGDGKTIHFLAPRPATGDRVTYDLFALTGESAPKLVAQNIDAYDLIN